MPTKQLPTQKVTFSILAPEAQSVKRKLKSGQWKATLSLTEGRHEYRYLVDGQWRDDPNCRTRIPNAFGGENCVCIVT